MCTGRGSYLNFRHRLLIERKKSHMTQERLAELLNVSPAHIHHLEKGNRYPSIQLLTQISDLFEISIDYLLAGRNGPQVNLNITISGLSPEQRDFLADILKLQKADLSDTSKINRKIV